MSGFHCIHIFSKQKRNNDRREKIKGESRDKIDKMVAFFQKQLQELARMYIGKAAKLPLRPFTPVVFVAGSLLGQGAKYS